MSTVNIESKKKEIHRFFEELATAIKREDIEGLLTMFADDFVCIFKKDAKIEGKTELKEYLRKGSLKNIIDVKHPFIRVEVSSSGDMAWWLGYEIVTYRRQEGTVETKIPFMLSFRKEDAKWKGVALCEAQRIEI